MQNADAPVQVHPMEYAGKALGEKLVELRAKLKEKVSPPVQDTAFDARTLTYTRPWLTLLIYSHAHLRPWLTYHITYTYLLPVQCHQDAHAMLVSALDEVAWLFNVRGGDVEFNPVTIAYAGPFFPPEALCVFLLRTLLLIDATMPSWGVSFGRVYTCDGPPGFFYLHK